MYIEGVMA